MFGHIHLTPYFLKSSIHFYFFQFFPTSLQISSHFLLPLTHPSTLYPPYQDSRHNTHSASHSSTPLSGLTIHCTNLSSSSFLCSPITPILVREQVLPLAGIKFYPSTLLIRIFYPLIENPFIIFNYGLVAVRKPARFTSPRSPPSLPSSLVICSPWPSLSIYLFLHPHSLLPKAHISVLLWIHTHYTSSSSFRILSSFLPTLPSLPPAHTFY